MTKPKKSFNLKKALAYVLGIMLLANAGLDVSRYVHRKVVEGKVAAMVRSESEAITAVKVTGCADLLGRAWFCGVNVEIFGQHIETFKLVPNDQLK